MAVYTPLSLIQAEKLLVPYALDPIIQHTGISDGIENTNYLTNTLNKGYILTIFEHCTVQQLGYFFQLLEHLSKQGMPVPQRIKPVLQSHSLPTWHDKPTALFQQLAGSSIQHSSAQHCAQIGKVLAQLHIAGKNFTLTRQNPWALTQIINISHTLINVLTPQEHALLKDELSFQQKITDNDLPQGLIHADLFRDNALFVEDQLSGIVDFYEACHAPFLFDIAISVNDWCIGDDHYIDAQKTRAFLHAYECIRPLTDNEKQQYSAMLRLAALRFWLSRLRYQHSTQQAGNNHKLITSSEQNKDPNVLKSLLLKHREQITFCQSLLYENN
jgi:homoserine kinase type II